MTSPTITAKPIINSQSLTLNFASYISLDVSDFILVFIVLLHGFVEHFKQSVWLAFVFVFKVMCALISFFLT